MAWNKALLVALALFASPALAQTVTPISLLPSATTPLAGSELLPIVQGGQTRKVAASALAGSGAYTANVPANTYSIGSDNDGTNWTPGYYDDVRITIGVARYTAAFTPPPAPFPNR